MQHLILKSLILSASESGCCSPVIAGVRDLFAGFSADSGFGPERFALGVQMAVSLRTFATVPTDMSSRTGAMIASARKRSKMTRGSGASAAIHGQRGSES